MQHFTLPRCRHSLVETRFDTLPSLVEILFSHCRIATTTIQGIILTILSPHTAGATRSNNVQALPSAEASFQLSVTAYRARYPRKQHSGTPAERHYRRPWNQHFSTTSAASATRLRKRRFSVSFARHHTTASMRDDETSAADHSCVVTVHLLQQWTCQLVTPLVAKTPTQPSIFSCRDTSIYLYGEKR